MKSKNVQTCSRTTVSFETIHICIYLKQRNSEHRLKTRRPWLLHEKNLSRLVNTNTIHQKKLRERKNISTSLTFDFSYSHVVDTVTHMFFLPHMAVVIVVKDRLYYVIYNQNDILQSFFPSFGKSWFFESSYQRRTKKIKMISLNMTMILTPWKELKSPPSH